MTIYGKPGTHIVFSRKSWKIFLQDLGKDKVTYAHLIKATQEFTNSQSKFLKGKTPGMKKLTRLCLQISWLLYVGSHEDSTKNQTEPKYLLNSNKNDFLHAIKLML